MSSQRDTVPGEEISPSDWSSQWGSLLFILAVPCLSPNAPHPPSGCLLSWLNFLSLLRHFIILLSFYCTIAFYYTNNRTPRSKTRPTLTSTCHPESKTHSYELHMNDSYEHTHMNPINHQGLPKKDRQLLLKFPYWALHFTQGLNPGAERKSRA